MAGALERGVRDSFARLQRAAESFAHRPPDHA
jgi:hypothetical protein